MSKLFYDMLPVDVKPMRRYDNKKQMVFENPDQKARADDRTQIENGNLDG
jgi:ASC-1-like (ASCH) protein